MATQITLRKDTAGNWTSNDPTLAAGEIGIAIDTSHAGKQPITGIKIGDGSTAWTGLEYAMPVFEHVNQVKNTANVTLHLKGLVSQSGEILKIENSDGEELIGVTQDPTSPIIKFLGDGVGSIQISGGYSADSTGRGTTIDVNGGIETNEAIEIGEYADDGSSGGVKIYHDEIGTNTEPDHGILKIAATADAADTDDCIIVHKGSDAKFTVEANGDVECNGVTASDNIVAAAGKKIEVGTWATDTSDSGVRIEDSTDHGRILLSSTTGSSGSDPVIQHKKRESDGSTTVTFEVENDGGLTTAGTPHNLGGIFSGVDESGSMGVGKMRSWHIDSMGTDETVKVNDIGFTGAGTYLVVGWALNNSGNIQRCISSKSAYFVYDGSGNETVLTFLDNNEHTCFGFCLRLS